MTHKGFIWGAMAFILVGGFLYGYFYKTKDGKPERLLSFYAPYDVDSTTPNGVVKIVKYHTVGAFNFIDQKGKTVTEADYKNKVYVADFFFTTCTGICPKMTKQMQRVASAFRNDQDVMFLSHTVNPEEDSVPVLAAYAESQKAIWPQWRFVTGNKPLLYNLARNGYFVTDTKGNGSAEDFVHTENFALVDKDKHIRGFYDGTDSVEVDRLIIDIKLLQKHYKYISQ